MSGDYDWSNAVAGEEIPSDSHDDDLDQDPDCVHYGIECDDPNCVCQCNDCPVEDDEALVRAIDESIAETYREEAREDD